MRILVTGNPNYKGLCKGIYEAYNHNFVEFIGRWNDWDLGDFEKVANYAKDFDVFVNSQLGLYIDHMKGNRKGKGSSARNDLRAPTKEAPANVWEVDYWKKVPPA